MKNDPVEDAIDAELFRFQKGEISYDEVHTNVLRVLEEQTYPHNYNKYVAYAGIMLGKVCLGKSNAT